MFCLNFAFCKQAKHITGEGPGGLVQAVDDDRNRKVMMIGAVHCRIPKHHFDRI